MMTAIGNLRQARDWLRRGNHPALLAVADGLDRYFDVNAEISLDAALGLLPAPGAEHWRTAARRTLRDAELRALADRFMPGIAASARAAGVAAMISRYEIRWRRSDSRLAAMPPTYAGRPDEYLFRAFRAFGGRMPSERSLRRML